MVKQAIRPAIFTWRQTEPELILCAVRWHLRDSLSFRDGEERLRERGLEADHTTIWCWVQHAALLHESSLARTMPTTGFSPADAIRHWSAEGGHPIEDFAAEDHLTPLPGWAPGAKAISDDGLVAEERILHPALTMVP